MIVIVLTILKFTALSWKEALQNTAWIVGIVAGIIAALNGIDTWLKSHVNKRAFRKREKNKCDSPEK